MSVKACNIYYSQTFEPFLAANSYCQSLDRLALHDNLIIAKMSGGRNSFKYFL